MSGVRQRPSLIERRVRRRVLGGDVVENEQAGALVYREALNDFPSDDRLPRRMAPDAGGWWPIRGKAVSSAS